MEALKLSYFFPFQRPKTHSKSNLTNFRFNPTPSLIFSQTNASPPKSSKIFTTISTTSTQSPNSEVESKSPGEKFDWYSQWYPLMPVCDLDKKVPHAKRVLGIDVVVWWDRNENAWKVFDDMCPHRLAPLSEGRIDQWGRLQCVYHGWCFGNSGDCKFIPQAPPDGPPVSLCFCFGWFDGVSSWFLTSYLILQIN